MSKKVILDFLKKYGLILITYFKSKLWEKVKKEFKKSYDQFKESLWNSIKEDIKAQLKSTIAFIEEVLNSAEYKTKEEAIINTLMQNVKLPFFLKPFRGAIKKVLHNKIKKLVEKNLKKINAIM